MRVAKGFAPYRDIVRRDFLFFGGLIQNVSGPFSSAIESTERVVRLHTTEAYNFVRYDRHR